MRAINRLLGTCLILVCYDAFAADVESDPFLVKFDSYLTSTGENLDIASRVSASFLINQVEGELGRFRGVGRSIAKVSTVIGLGGIEGFTEETPVMLSFDGKDIFASGLDGPYQVADVTVISDGGIVMDQNPAPWLTAAYEALDFGVVVLDEIILKDGFE